MTLGVPDSTTVPMSIPSLQACSARSSLVFHVQDVRLAVKSCFVVFMLEFALSIFVGSLGLSPVFYET